VTDPVILAAGAAGAPTDEAAPAPVTAEAVSSPEEARS